MYKFLISLLPGLHTMLQGKAYNPGSREALLLELAPGPEELEAQLADWNLSALTKNQTALFG